MGTMKFETFKAGKWQLPWCPDECAHTQRFDPLGTLFPQWRGANVYQGQECFPANTDPTHPHGAVRAGFGQTRRTGTTNAQPPVPTTISAPTANTLIKTLIEKDILTEVTGQQRGRLYACTPYLNLFLI